MHTAAGSAAAIRSRASSAFTLVRLDRLDAEPRGGLGHGRGRQLASAAAWAVGPGDHELRPVRSGREPVQDRRREVRGPEIDGALIGASLEAEARRAGFLQARTPGTCATSRRGRSRLYEQVFDPVSDSLGLTAIFAALPLITLFVLLGGLRMKAQWAALIALAVAMLVALIVYDDAVGPVAAVGQRGRGVRALPDHVDRRHGDLGLQHDRRDRPLRGAPPIVRRRSPTTSGSRP